MRAATRKWQQRLERFRDLKTSKGHAAAYAYKSQFRKWKAKSAE